MNTRKPFYLRFLCIFSLLFVVTMLSCTSEREYAAEDFLQEYHHRDMVNANVHGVSLIFYKKDTDGKKYIR